MSAAVTGSEMRMFFIEDLNSTNGTFLKPQAGDPLLLRRDVTQLEGEGLIGLGQRVDEDHPLAVRFRIL